MLRKQEKSINNIIKSNLKLAGKKVPVIYKGKNLGTFTLPKKLTEDQAAGRTPVYVGKDFEYYMTGDGSVGKVSTKAEKNKQGGNLNYLNLFI